VLPASFPRKYPVCPRAITRYALGIDPSLSVPTVITFVVDWPHIREAERQARRTVVSPARLAIQEQTRFVNGTFANGAVILIDGPTRRRFCYADPPALRAYMTAWARGEAVEPATFSLELPE
jgi:hypothetical protein